MQLRRDPSPAVRRLDSKEKSLEVMEINRVVFSNNLMKVGMLYVTPVSDLRRVSETDLGGL